MKPEWKRKWVKALRSGEYKQGHWQLKNRDEYCCLGVLCDIYQAGHWEGTEFIYKRDLATAFLPGKLSEQLAITAKQESDLAHMNDSGGYDMDFNKIADYIEENL